MTEERKSYVIVLDTETNGLEAQNFYGGVNHGICQISYKVLHDGIESTTIPTQTVFIKPYYESPYGETTEAYKINQISKSVIDGGVRIQTVVDDLIFLSKMLTQITTYSNGNVRTILPTIVCHNVEFDKKFLIEAFKYCLVEDIETYFNFFCTQQFAMLKWEIDGQSLIKCCERVGIKVKGAHSASGDVEMTKQLYKYFIHGIEPVKNNQ
jgi:DNA polymerase III epsilon subunit-like protein